MNKLFGTRAYLCGAMDLVTEDSMTIWRDDMTKFLNSLGVIVLNPLKKNIPDGDEGTGSRQRRKYLKSQLRFDEASHIMKEVRHVDLRMVDVSDFLIVNSNIDEHACGTYEEITVANRSKKPVIVHVEQGKTNGPDWLMLGMLPHELVFSSWDEVKDYIRDVDSGKDTRTFKRWLFLDMLTPTLEALKTKYHIIPIFGEN